MAAAFDALIHSAAAGGRVSKAFTLRQSNPANKGVQEYPVWGA